MHLNFPHKHSETVRKRDCTELGHLGFLIPTVLVEQISSIDQGSSDHIFWFSLGNVKTYKNIALP